MKFFIFIVLEILRAQCIPILGLWPLSTDQLEALTGFAGEKIDLKVDEKGVNIERHHKKVEETSKTRQNYSQFDQHVLHQISRFTRSIDGRHIKYRNPIYDFDKNAFRRTYIESLRGKISQVEQGAVHSLTPDRPHVLNHKANTGFLKPKDQNGVLNQVHFFRKTTSYRSKGHLYTYQPFSDTEKEHRYKQPSSSNPRRYSKTFGYSSYGHAGFWTAHRRSGSPHKHSGSDYENRGSAYNTGVSYGIGESEHKNIGSNIGRSGSGYQDDESTNDQSEYKSRLNNSPSRTTYVAGINYRHSKYPNKLSGFGYENSEFQHGNSRSTDKYGVSTYAPIRPSNAHIGSTIEHDGSSHEHIGPTRKSDGSNHETSGSDLRNSGSGYEHVGSDYEHIESTHKHSGSGYENSGSRLTHSGIYISPDSEIYSQIPIYSTERYRDDLHLRGTTFSYISPQNAYTIDLSRSSRSSTDHSLDSGIGNKSTNGTTTSHGHNSDYKTRVLKPKIISTNHKPGKFETFSRKSGNSHDSVIIKDKNNDPDIKYLKQNHKKQDFFEEIGMVLNNQHEFSVLFDTQRNSEKNKYETVKTEQEYGETDKSNEITESDNDKLNKTNCKTNNYINDRTNNTNDVQNNTNAKFTRNHMPNYTDSLKHNDNKINKKTINNLSDENESLEYALEPFDLFEGYDDDDFDTDSDDYIVNPIIDVNKNKINDDDYLVADDKTTENNEHDKNPIKASKVRPFISNNIKLITNRRKNIRNKLLKSVLEIEKKRKRKESGDEKPVKTLRSAKNEKIMKAISARKGVAACKRTKKTSANIEKTHKSDTNFSEKKRTDAQISEILDLETEYYNSDKETTTKRQTNDKDLMDGEISERIKKTTKVILKKDLIMNKKKKILVPVFTSTKSPNIIVTKPNISVIYTTSKRIKHKKLTTKPMKTKHKKTKTLKRTTKADKKKKVLLDEDFKSITVSHKVLSDIGDKEIDNTAMQKPALLLVSAFRLKSNQSSKFDNIKCIDCKISNDTQDSYNKYKGAHDGKTTNSKTDKAHELTNNVDRHSNNAKSSSTNFKQRSDSNSNYIEKPTTSAVSETLDLITENLNSEGHTTKKRRQIDETVSERALEYIKELEEQNKQTTEEQETEDKSPKKQAIHSMKITLPLILLTKKPEIIITKSDITVNYNNLQEQEIKHTTKILVTKSIKEKPKVTKAVKRTTNTGQNKKKLIDKDFKTVTVRYKVRDTASKEINHTSTQKPEMWDGTKSHLVSKLDSNQRYDSDATNRKNNNIKNTLDYETTKATYEKVLENISNSKANDCFNVRSLEQKYECKMINATSDNALELTDYIKTPPSLLKDIRPETITEVSDQNVQVLTTTRNFRSQKGQELYKIIKSKNKEYAKTDTVTKESDINYINVTDPTNKTQNFKQTVFNEISEKISTTVTTEVTNNISYVDTNKTNHKVKDISESMSQNENQCLEREQINNDKTKDEIIEQLNENKNNMDFKNHGKINEEHSTRPINSETIKPYDKNERNSKYSTEMETVHNNTTEQTAVIGLEIYFKKYQNNSISLIKEKDSYNRTRFNDEVKSHINCEFLNTSEFHEIQTNKASLDRDRNTQELNNRDKNNYSKHKHGHLLLTQKDKISLRTEENILVTTEKNKKAYNERVNNNMPFSKEIISNMKQDMEDYSLGIKIQHKKEPNETFGHDFKLQNYLKQDNRLSIKLEKNSESTSMKESSNEAPHERNLKTTHGRDKNSFQSHKETHEDSHEKGDTASRENKNIHWIKMLHDIINKDIFKHNNNRGERQVSFDRDDTYLYKTHNFQITKLDRNTRDLRDRDSKPKHKRRNERQLDFGFEYGGDDEENTPKPEQIAETVALRFRMYTTEKYEIKPTKPKNLNEKFHQKYFKKCLETDETAEKDATKYEIKDKVKTVERTEKREKQIFKHNRDRMRDEIKTLTHSDKKNTNDNINHNNTEKQNEKVHESIESKEMLINNNTKNETEISNPKIKGAYKHATDQRRRKSQIVERETMIKSRRNNEEINNKTHKIDDESINANFKNESMYNVTEEYEIKSRNNPNESGDKSNKNNNKIGLKGLISNEEKRRRSNEEHNNKSHKIGAESRNANIKNESKNDSTEEYEVKSHKKPKESGDKNNKNNIKIRHRVVINNDETIVNESFEEFREYFKKSDYDYE